MAQYRTTPMHRVRKELAVLKASAALLLAACSIAGLTGAAQAPGPRTEMAYSAVADRATLTRAGTDLIITGSVGDIFRSQSFVGTNKALKQDRSRPAIGLAEFDIDFSSIRARIASLRNPGAPAPQSPVVAETQALPGEMPVAVAAIEPSLTTPALDAIDQLAGTSDGAPVPFAMSEKLAYARADLPATVFDGTVSDGKGKKFSEKEVWCMATAIYFEARGESYRGQVAVGQVVMNRVSHKLYPDTICGVVFQNQSKRNACQFSFACDGIPERVSESKSWDQAMQIAKDVIYGREYIAEVGYSTHYHATYVYPHWAPRMKKNTKIGLHVFYQFKRGWKFG
jgi:spore germination cell wall hydrolase CwlJ-like protein